MESLTLEIYRMRKGGKYMYMYIYLHTHTHTHIYIYIYTHIYLSGGGHGNPFQYSYLENRHGQRSLAGYSPWGHRVRHNWPRSTLTHVLSHSVVSDCLATPWTVAHQAPLSMGISQARKLEWVAISSSRGSSWPRDWTCISCIGRWILYHLRHLRSVYILPLCWSDASKLNFCKVNKAKFSNYRELSVALNPCAWTGFFLLFQIAIPIPCVLKWPLSHAAGFY